MMSGFEINTQADFCVIGAGLAGSEAALTLANHGAKVLLVEQKPKYFSPAHQLKGAAELVCSNSFKSLELHSAHGLLKEELRFLDSPVLRLALQSRVPGGKSLSVDREIFSERVTTELKTHPLIQFVADRVDSVPEDIPCLIATGPLTSEGLAESLKALCGDEGLYFYDATSPVVTLESLDLSRFFWASRNQDGDDYLNLPLTKEEYFRFRQDVLDAEKIESHIPGEELCFFEGCLPIEELARRGEDTLAYSCMKPIGFQAHTEKKAYAVIQFRREKAAGDLLSMVGFQTRMKWPEQLRVFRGLPGMQNAEFVRLGVMHRNLFINSPLHLNDRLQMKKAPHLFFAGQITGSEGYTEALASGHYAALQMLNAPDLPETTSIRSLIRYIVHADPRHFQPMNFNFGLLPPLDRSSPEKTAKMEKRHERLSKSQRSELKAARALRDLRRWKDDYRKWRNFSFGTRLSAPALVLTPTELVGLISNDS